MFETVFARAPSREGSAAPGAHEETNDQGWRIVGIGGDPADLATVTARISNQGEEVFTVRFDEAQLEPPRPTWRQRIRLSPEQQENVVEQARDFRDGIRGDGHRGPPPPEEDSDVETS